MYKRILSSDISGGGGDFKISLTVNDTEESPRIRNRDLTYNTSISNLSIENKAIIEINSELSDDKTLKVLLGESPYTQIIIHGKKVQLEYTSAAPCGVKYSPLLEELILPECTDLTIDNETFSYNLCNLTVPNLETINWVGKAFEYYGYAWYYDTTRSKPSLDLSNINISGRSYYDFRCAVLDVLKLPATGNSFGTWAFANCNINELGLYSSTVCQVEDKYTLNRASINKIYVPSSLVSAYKSDNNWKSFTIQTIP